MSKARYDIVAKNQNEVDVYFYGLIGRYYSQDVRSFSSQIKTLESQGYKKVNLHVHSEGGEVFEGVAIFNAIVNSKMEFHAYVDGIAASMASIIVLACKKVFMAKNTFMMIHAPSGGASGSAKDLRKYADLLEKVETTLLDHYVSKTGKDKAYISKWMDGDNWFTTQEALTEGLIDGIVDEKVNKDRPQNYKELTPAAAYDYFITALLTDTQPPVNIQNSMDKKLLITALGINSINADMADSDIIAGLKTHIDAQASRVAALETQAKNDERLIAELNEQVTAANKAAIKSYLDAAEKESKKITAAQRADYEKLCDNGGFEVVKAIIDKMPTRTKITDQINNGGKSAGEGDGGKGE